MTRNGNYCLTATENVIAILLQRDGCVIIHRGPALPWVHCDEFRTGWCNPLFYASRDGVWKCFEIHERYTAGNQISSSAYVLFAHCFALPCGNRADARKIVACFRVISNPPCNLQTTRTLRYRSIHSQGNLKKSIFIAPFIAEIFNSTPVPSPRNTTLSQRVRNYFTSQSNSFLRFIRL